MTTFGVFVLISLCLLPVIGQDFFPSTDAGIMKLHYRRPSGTRIEYTEQLVQQVENRIRQIIPASELVTVNSTIGIPGSLNLAFVPTDNASGMDAEILIQLAEQHHPTQGYVNTLRDVLNREFPGSTVYFQTADIVGQVLNFGLSAPDRCPDPGPGPRPRVHGGPDAARSDARGAGGGRRHSEAGARLPHPPR